MDVRHTKHGTWTLAELKRHLMLDHGYEGYDYQGTDLVPDVDGTYGWATAEHTHDGDHEASHPPFDMVEHEHDDRTNQEG